MLSWQTIDPQGGDYAFEQGHRYAALASVSENYSIADVTSYLSSHGWEVTYSWEQGTPTRATYAIDDWLAALPADETSNHRWVYAELNRTGVSASVGVHSSWPLSIYRIAHVYEALPTTTPAPETSPVTTPSRSAHPYASPLYTVIGYASIGVAAFFFYKAAFKP